MSDKDPPRFKYVVAYDMGFREAQSILLAPFEALFVEMQNYKPSEPDTPDRAEERAYWASRLAAECFYAAKRKP